MRCPAISLFAGLAVIGLVAGATVRGAGAEQPESGLGRQPQAKQDAPKTAVEERADLYARLAASKDADETEGLINRLLHLYSESGSDTGDLLLQRARHAIGAERYAAAVKILDQTVALLPDWAEGWNALATARYLDDDYYGSMADIAQTLKREPNHLGALVGMAAILEARGKREDALKVYERALKIAPHWRNAERAAEKLKAALAGQEL